MASGSRQNKIKQSPAIRSFTPVSQPTARVLILGSIPGQASLQASQYYAQPRNAFWHIMAELFDFLVDLPYEERLQKLTDQRIALWDVLQACQRPGSLDSSIIDASIETNDFLSFYLAHPHIILTCFNGVKAAAVFTKKVLPSIAPTIPNMVFRQLPSTSPAHATLSYRQKLEKWSFISAIN